MHHKAWCEKNLFERCGERSTLLTRQTIFLIATLATWISAMRNLDLLLQGKNLRRNISQTTSPKLRHSPLKNDLSPHPLYLLLHEN